MWVETLKHLEAMQTPSRMALTGCLSCQKEGAEFTGRHNLAETRQYVFLISQQNYIH